jgi:hypothetical protein
MDLISAEGSYQEIRRKKATHERDKCGGPSFYILDRIGVTTKK